MRNRKDMLLLGENVIKIGIAVMAVVLVLMSVKVMGDAKLPSGIADFIAAHAQTSGKQEAVKNSLAKSYLTLSAEQAKKRDVFNPIPQKSFAGRIEGVLGDRVYLSGGQNGKVGDMVMGAKILGIGADWAEIEFDGQKRTLWVWGQGSKTDEERAAETTTGNEGSDANQRRLQRGNENRNKNAARMKMMQERMRRLEMLNAAERRKRIMEAKRRNNNLRFKGKSATNKKNRK